MVAKLHFVKLGTRDVFKTLDISPEALLEGLCYNVEYLNPGKELAHTIPMETIGVHFWDAVRYPATSVLPRFEMECSLRLLK